MKPPRPGWPAARGRQGPQRQGAGQTVLVLPDSHEQCRVRLQAAQTDSITGTSTSTPTTVAKAAPEPGPNSAIAVATASSKKLLAPIRAPGRHAYSP